MDKSSKPSSKDRKERYAWSVTGVATLTLRAKKYYYVKMIRWARGIFLFFWPDSKGRPVSDLAEAIPARPARWRSNLRPRKVEKLRELSNGKRRPSGAISTFTTALSQVSQNRSLQLHAGSSRMASQTPLRKRGSDHSAATYFACIASRFRWRTERSCKSRTIPQSRW